MRTSTNETQKENIMKLNIVCTDVCLPDYFSGDSRPWLCIPVDGRTTFKQVRDMLKDEVRQGAFGGFNDLYTLLAADWLPERYVKKADKAIKALYAAINRDIKPVKKGARCVFPDLEKSTENDDGFDSVYAYFVITEE